LLGWRRGGWGLVQDAGCDLGSWFLSLENGDLVAELLDRFFDLAQTLLLQVNDGKQSLNKWGSLGYRDFGDLDPHAFQHRKTQGEQLRLSRGF